VTWAGTVAGTLAALTLAAGTGSAAAPASMTPEVSLELQRCSRFPRPEIVRLVSLELDARVVPPGGGGPHATRGVIACGVDSVRLEVSDPLAGTFLSRTLPAAAHDAGAASRIAALALAELVFTSWLELAQPRPQAMTDDAPPRELRRAALERAQRHASAAAAPGSPTERTAAPEESETAAPPPSPAPAVPAVVAAPPAVVAEPGPTRPHADGIYVLAVGQATGPFRGIGLAWGAGLRVGWSSGATLFSLATAPVGLAGDLDLTAAWTDVDGANGSVRVSTWSAGPRVALRLDLSERRTAWIDVGAGARVGVARLVGAPTDPTTYRGGSLAGTWGGAAGYAGVGFALRSVVVAAGVEGGQVLRTVSGMVDGDRPVSLAGRWLSGSLALGWGR